METQLKDTFPAILQCSIRIVKISEVKLCRVILNAIFKQAHLPLKDRKLTTNAHFRAMQTSSVDNNC